MVVCGNDVVDLKHADSERSLADERFFLRVFAPSERSLILGANCPHTMLWTIWALKEAAYKALRACFPVPFAWSKYVVSSDLSQVTYGEHLLSSRVLLHGECVEAICCFSGGAAFSWEDCWFEVETFFEVYESLPPDERLSESEELRMGLSLMEAKEISPELESRFLRFYARFWIAHLLGVALERVRIGQREGGVPEVRLDDGVLPVSLSLSHHGRYVGGAVFVEGVRIPGDRRLA